MARGRPPAHSLDRIVEAAVRIADAEGLAAVTMRRVAGEIGAGAMSLYTYVPTRDRLVDLMVDRVGATPAQATATGDWQTDLLALARELRSQMLAHPWLPEALPNRRLSGRNMLAFLERGLAALAPTGLDGATKLEIVALTTGFVASFVTAELAGSVSSEDQVAMIGEAVASGEFPQLAAVLQEGGGRSAEPDFDRIATWTVVGLVEQARRFT